MSQASEVKIFKIVGGRHSKYLQKALLQRGWKESSRDDIAGAHLVWALKPQNVDHLKLENGQLYNHFGNASILSTKVGLIKCLQELHWSSNQSKDQIFPRCFDLYNKDSREDFKCDVLFTCAVGLLKHAIIGINVMPAALKAAVTAVQYFIDSKVRTDMYNYNDQVNEVDGLAQRIRYGLNQAQQVNVLTQCKLLAQKCKGLQNQKTYEDKFTTISSLGSVVTPKQNSESSSRASSPDCASTSSQTEHCRNQVSVDQPEFAEHAQRLLQKVAQYCPQMYMDGLYSMWLIKPAGKSRGRGITVYNDPVQLLNFADKLGEEAQWIAQKYIERPLLINEKKFDIRQWVLVVSWNPLQAYFYKDCYVRIATSKFQYAKLDKSRHLCNFSVQKKYHKRKNFNEGSLNNCIWDIDTMKEYLVQTHGENKIWESIDYGMREACRGVLKAAQPNVKDRVGSCQLFGFDFMVDDQHKVWLIEVNCSPTMEHGTVVTADLCPRVQEDIVKVIIDQKLADERSRSKSKLPKQIGRFEILLNDKHADVAPSCVQLSLQVQGIKQNTKGAQQPKLKAVNTAYGRILKPLLSSSDDEDQANESDKDDIISGWARSPTQNHRRGQQLERDYFTKKENDKMSQKLLSQKISQYCRSSYENVQQHRRSGRNLHSKTSSSCSQIGRNTKDSFNQQTAKIRQKISHAGEFERRIGRSQSAYESLPTLSEKVLPQQQHLSQKQLKLRRQRVELIRQQSQKQYYARKSQSQLPQIRSLVPINVELQL